MLTTATLHTTTRDAPSRPGIRGRLREARRLRRADRDGEHLARLDAVDALLGRVHDRLQAGWTQDAWFTTLETDGVLRHVGSLHAERADHDSATCLIAAVAVEALPGSVTGPVAQRAVNAMWTVLHGSVPSAEHVAPPAVTTVRAYDLIRWNDAPDRRHSDVLALVHASRSAVGRSAAVLRGRLASA